MPVHRLIGQVNLEYNHLACNGTDERKKWNVTAIDKIINLK